MAVTLTIGGVAKELQRGTLRISQTANGRATASFAVFSGDGTYRPAQDAEVIIQEDAVTIFGGLIEKPKERGHGSHDGIVTTVSAVDYHAYAERRFVNTTLAAGTLKSQLTTLRTTYLDVYGVTLHASQVDGPSLPALVCDYLRLDEVLNQLMTNTADAGEPFVWRIDASKVLRAFQPSTTLAPFNISGNTPAQVIGDIEVETDKDVYANRVFVKVAPKDEKARVESFTGNGTDDFVTLQYTPYSHVGYVTYDGVFETLTTTGLGTASWILDPPTGVLTRTAGPIGNGLAVSITFDGLFSGTWTAEDGTAATNPREAVVKLDSIPSDTTGQAVADAELAKRQHAAKRVLYRTNEAGLQTTQTQTITVPRRNLSVTGVISDLSIRDFGKTKLQRTVTVVVDAALTNLGRGFRDDYKTWYGDKSGGSATTSVGSGTVASGPAPPFKAVQFNNSGQFGGDASFTYDEATNSIVCGLDSSITAASHESCQVFGNDCHIADP